MKAVDTKSAHRSRLGGALFRPEIEGLRAIAVLAVVLYHAGVPGFGGGYVGVDVFFVISGYLITGLLLAEAAKDGRLDPLDFYARRVRRLVPAGLLAIALTVAVHAARTSPEQRGALFVSALTALTYTSNLYFSGAAFAYFDPGVARDPLLHTWSLGVEAQFYLVWPLVVGCLARRPGALLAIIAVVAAASYAASILLTPVNLPLAFYGLPARLWELGAGAALAVRPPPVPLAFRLMIGIGGLIAVLLAVVLLSAATPYPGGLSAWPVLGAAAVVFGLERQGGGDVLLAWPPLQAIGRLSYGWYLWHWPLLTYLDLARPGAGLPWRAAAVLAALGLAALSYRFVELPVRRSRRLAQRSGLTLGLGAGATALVIAFAWRVTRPG